MGFLEGKASFSQFEIANSNEMKARLADPTAYYSRIKAFAFRDIALDQDAESIGWTSVDNVLDTQFQADLTDGSRYRIFALRLDRRTIPTSVVKMRCLQAETKKLTETGQKRLYREQKRIIRESVVIELTKAIPPVPHIYEVIWDVGKGVVYFGSLSLAAIDAFVPLFYKSFGLILQPAGLSLSPMAEGNIRVSFLTWLWFKSEEHDGAIALSDGAFIPLFFTRRVALESGEGSYAEQVLCSGEHSDLLEAKEALRQGKKVVEARIRMDSGHDEFEFTVYANGYQYKGLKFPVTQAEQEAPDRTGMALERIWMLEKGTDTMALLFAEYAKLRKTDAWGTEEAKMFQWLEK